MTSKKLRCQAKRSATGLLSACAGVALSGTPLSLSANLVVDGSFEAPIASSPFQTFNASISPVGGWTVTAGSIDLINGYWHAADGNQSIDLSGNSRGTIEQSINTGPGLYHLTFALSGNSDGPPTVKTVQVTFGSATAQFSFTTPWPNGNNIPNIVWASESWDVYLPTGGNTTLSFQDISGGYEGPYGAALDNIVLTQASAVPESGTLLAGALLLLPLGLSAVRIVRWHHRSS